MRIQFKRKDKVKKTEVRFNINLTLEHYEFLKKVSEDTYLSMSEIVRQIFDTVKKDYEITNNEKDSSNSR